VQETSQPNHSLFWTAAIPQHPCYTRLHIPHGMPRNIDCLERQHGLLDFILSFSHESTVGKNVCVDEHLRSIAIGAGYIDLESWTLDMDM